MLWFPCLFFVLLRAVLRLLKKEEPAALSSPAGAEGMLTPRRARDAEPQSPPPRGSPLLHGPAKPPSPCRADRRGSARVRAPASFNLPSKASLQGGRECHLRERLFKQHLPCLPLPLASDAAAALMPRDKRGTGDVWEEGGRTAQSPSPTRSFSLSVQGK